MYARSTHHGTDDKDLGLAQQFKVGNAISIKLLTYRLQRVYQRTSEMGSYIHPCIHILRMRTENFIHIYTKTYIHPYVQTYSIYCTCPCIHLYIHATCIHTLSCMYVLTERCRTWVVKQHEDDGGLHNTIY